MQKQNDNNNSFSIYEYAIGSVSNRKQYHNKDYEQQLYLKEEAYKSLYNYNSNKTSYDNNDQSIIKNDEMVCSDEIVIDIDFKKEDGTGDIEKGQNVLRKLLRHIESTYETNLSYIKTEFSGNKGFHIRIPAALFGGFEPSNYLPKLQKEIVKQLTVNMEGIDTRIYHSSSLMRIPNTINSESGLYSIPLDYKSIYTLSNKEIIEMAKKPNLSYQFIDQSELEVNSNLKELKEKIIKELNYKPTQDQLLGSDNNDTNLSSFTENNILPIEYWDIIQSRCNILNELYNKAEKGSTINNLERLFLGTIAIQFGDLGRLKVHKILSTQQNYSVESTDYHLRQIKEQKYKPILCDSICSNKCQNIKLLNRNSPMAFARENNLKYNQTTALNEFIKYYKELLLFKVKSQTMYLFNGSYFEEINDLELEAILNSFLMLLFPPEKISGHVISGLLKRIKMSDQFIYNGELNPNKTIINVRNGMLDLDRMELLPHSPEYKSTVQLNVYFDPKAKCDLFEEKLNEIFDGDEDSIDIVLQFMLYSFLPTYEDQKFMIFYGSTGRNGKGLLANIVTEFLTKNSSFENFSDLASDRNYSLVHLKDKYINVSSELSTKEAEIDVIKRLTGGDYISTREIYKGKVQFRNIARLLILTNGLPRVTNLDKAFLARIIIINFPKSFADNPDTGLFEKLKKEMSGIFNLILSKKDKLIGKNGSIKLTIPVSITHNVNKYMFHFHSVAEFLHEMCEVYDPENSEMTEYGTKLKTIFDEYRDWSEAAGYKPVARKTFKEVIISITKAEFHQVNYVKSLNDTAHKSQVWLLGVKLNDSYLSDTANGKNIRNAIKNTKTNDVED